MAPHAARLQNTVSPPSECYRIIAIDASSCDDDAADNIRLQRIASLSGEPTECARSLGKKKKGSVKRLLLTQCNKYFNGKLLILLFAKLQLQEVYLIS